MADYLRSCAGCSAHILAPWCPADRDANPTYCSRCSTGLAVVVEIGGVVRLYSEPSWRQYCVLARDGDALTVRQLGHPDGPSFETTVHQVRPEFSYDRVQRGRQRVAQA